MSQVFVTGATGVLGRRAVPLLVRHGHRVTSVARTPEKADWLRGVGADPVALDLLDGAALRRSVDGHDAVLHLATHIPTGADAAMKRAWRENDRLRRGIATGLAAAAASAGVPRFVQESITFPYTDGAADWIDEEHMRTYHFGTASSAEAEANALAFGRLHGVGVVLRFAMFYADDSAHMHMVAKLAKRGVFGLPGAPERHISFVHVDDAAAAVVAALDAPSGVYNVAESDPQPRSEHIGALASAFGRRRLRTMPAFTVKLGGAAMETLARSQRISSQRLQGISTWRPERAIVDAWPDLAKKTLR